MDKAQPRFGASLVIFVCFLAAAIEGYDIQAFGVSAPKLAPELQLNPGQVGWLGSIAMVGLVIGAFVGGWLADRIGRKPVLIASVATFGVFSLATAAAHSYDMMQLARLLTGIGFGGALPNLIALAVEVAKPQRSAATVTAMTCGMPVGGASVSLAARLLGDDLPWRELFVAGGVIPLLLVPLMLFVLPETRPQAEPTADRNLLRGLFGEGRAGATVTIWAVFACTLIILYLALNWLPTLVVAKGLAPSDGFVAAFAFNIAGAVGSAVLGLLCDRVGWKVPLLLAYLVLAAAMAGMAGAGEPLTLAALAAVAGVGVMGAQFVLYSVAPKLYPPVLRGAGAGAAVAVGRLGSIAGPLIGGELRGAGATAGQVFMAMAPVALVAAVGLVILGRLAKTVD